MCTCILEGVCNPYAVYTVYFGGCVQLGTRCTLCIFIAVYKRVYTPVHVYLSLQCEPDMAEAFCMIY